MKQFWLIIILCNLFVLNAWTQHEVGFSQYFTAMGYYNPAFAGKTGDLNVITHSRLQWAGAIDNAPASGLVVADMPWKSRKIQQGIGIVALFDKAGSLETTTNISAQYAYKRKLGKGILSIGLQLGLINISFDGSKAITDPTPNGESNDHQGEDEIVATSMVSGKGLDAAAGLLYYTDKFYVGIASTHLSAPKLKMDENMERQVDRYYNLTAGYNIQMKNPLFELQPSLLVHTNLQMVSGNVTARVIYNKMYNGGLGTRISDRGRIDAAILYVGATIKRVRLGYSYDFPTSSVISKSGSHELMLSYQLQLNKPKGNRNKHKSIRIL